MIKKYNVYTDELNKNIIERDDTDGQWVPADVAEELANALTSMLADYSFWDNHDKDFKAAAIKALARARGEV